MARNISKNKLPSELSDEELLKQAESASEEIAPQAPNNVVSFLLFYNIGPGSFPVKCSVLYKLYQAYTKEPITLEQFFNQTANYIPWKKLHASHFFYINKSAFSIADKTFKLLNLTKIQQSNSPIFRRHYENFLKANNIQDGNIWNSSTVLYQEYMDWCKNTGKRKKISQINFNKFCVLYFKEKIVNGKKYYKLNKEFCEKETKENKEKSTRSN
jgi:hypothetical protein